MPNGADILADGVRAERAGVLERALESYELVASTADDPATRAEALTRAADIYRSRCEWDKGIEMARRAQDVARAAHLFRHLTESAIAEANVFMCRGDFDNAIRKFQTVVATTDDARLRGVALQNLGSMWAQTGKWSAAESAFLESIGNFHAADYARGEVIALNNLARLALDERDHVRARPLLERAIERALAIEDSELASLASLNLACAHCALGDLDRAQDLAMSALGYFSACGNRWREIECLRLMGEINERHADPVNASRCYERALALAEEIGSPVEIRVTQARLHALNAASGVISPAPAR